MSSYTIDHKQLGAQILEFFWAFFFFWAGGGGRFFLRLWDMRSL